MKKTLLATAIAGVMGFSVAAQAAEGPTVYGNVQTILKSIDDGSEKKEELADNGTTIGVKGSHDIGNGLTGIYKIEFDVGAADEIKGKDDLLVGDQAYFGVQGAFGTVKVGSFDTIYNNFVQDSIDITESGTALVSPIADTDEGNQVNFTSNNINGLVVAAEIQFVGDDELDGTDETKDGTAFAVAASYTVGNVTVSAAFDNAGNTAGEEEAFGAAVSVDLGQVNVVGKFETTSDVNAFGAGATFDYGMGTIYGGLQQIDPDQGDGGLQLAVGANYNVADNFYVYAEFANNEEEVAAGVEQAYAVGAVYSF